VKENSLIIPVMILCYQRPNHLAEVLSGLEDDPLSVEFPIYIFVDGLKIGHSAEEKNNQEEILEIIHKFSENGNRHVKHFVSPENKGVFQAVLWGTEIVFKEHDALIYLEEDVVPKRGYLLYMKSALNFYKDNKQVYAINAYSFKEIEKYINVSGFTAYRFRAPGFATYKRMWEQVEWNINSIRWKKWSPIFWLKFNKNSWGWGWTLFAYAFFPAIRSKIQPWDILFFLHHYLRNRVAIWSNESAVINIGLDGSGIHEAGEFEQDYSKKTIDPESAVYLTDTEVDVSIINAGAKVLIPLYRRKSFKTGFKLFRKVAARWKKK